MDSESEFVGREQQLAKARRVRCKRRAELLK